MKVRVKLTYFELSPATANPPIEWVAPPTQFSPYFNRKSPPVS
jgi:hypothetical protein